MAKQSIELQTSTITGAPLTPFQEMARTWSLGGIDGVLHYSNGFDFHPQTGLQFSILNGIAVVGGCLVENYSATFDVEQYRNYVIYLQVEYDSSAQSGKSSIIVESIVNLDDITGMFPGDDLLTLDKAFPVRKMPLFYIETTGIEIVHLEDLRVFDSEIRRETTNLTDKLKKLDEDTGWIPIRYVSGFIPGTAGQLMYRCKGGIMTIIGGAAGTFPSGETTIAAAGAIPYELRPTQHLRTAAAGSKSIACTSVVTADDGRVVVGWATAQSSSAPTWISINVSYPIG